MKSLRFALTAILMSISAAAFGQHEQKVMTGRFDLQRTKEASGPFGR